MCTASPKMSSLPILALLLLLLAHRTPPAQGNPLRTTYITTLINEIRDLLKQPALPKVELQPGDKFTLGSKTLLRTNLEEFLHFAEKFKNKTEKITKILTEFRTVVPTAPSMNGSINMEGSDWDDFRRKLMKYLDTLWKFVTARI